MPDQGQPDKAPADLIKLIPGDGSKTKILLIELMDIGTMFRFLPIEISAEANAILLQDLQNELPQLIVEAQIGDYFERIQALNEQSRRRKVILFLSFNFGNISDAETADFMRHLEELTNPGDQVMIGFDLKKSPALLLPFLNNSALVKISKGQRADHPEVWQTTLHNPDFAEYTQNCGAMGIRVDKRDELIKAPETLFSRDEPGRAEINSDVDLI
mgnify:CR=1 FL=1